MPKVVSLIKKNHPFIGVWQGEDEDARAQYEIAIENGTFVVTAKDAIDGEEFIVSNIKWDSQKETLSFDTVMPSTERLGSNIFRLIAGDRIEAEFTFTYKGIWKKVANHLD